MNKEKYLKESKRFLKYVFIGIFTTLLTWIIWNSLYYMLTNFDQNSNNRIVLFGISQFLASFIVIYPSFWLNRKITFKDKNQRHSKKRFQFLNIYLIYILAPLLSSLIIFIINSLFPKLLDFNLSQIYANYELEIGKLFLQILGFGLAAIFNFSAQRFWLYK